LQDYQQQLFSLEHQNKHRILIARERQLNAKEQTLRDQRNAASRKASVEEVPQIEGYRDYLLSVQSQTDERLQQVREEEEQREAADRKREFERIRYMRRKDSGIYCETVYTQKSYDDDCPIPEEDEGCDLPDTRRGSRVDSWVDAQAKRRSCGFADDVMLPKKMKYQLSGLEGFHEQQQRRSGREQVY
jgi:hypothetical protein